MALWPMTDDDYEAMEAERLWQQRSEEDRQFEREFLEQQDRENAIEDQDILDRRWRESIDQDPDAQLAWEKFVENDAQEAEAAAAEQAFWDKLARETMEKPIAPQFSCPMLPTNSTLEAPQAPLMQPRRLIPNEKFQKTESQQQTADPQQETEEKISPQPRKSHSDADDKLTSYDVAQKLIAHEHFLVIKNAIYWFNKRIYELLSKENALRLIVDRCRLEVKRVGSGNFVEQVFKCLQQEPSIVRDDLLPSPDEVAFLDGVLNLKTGDFLPHSPKFFVTSYLNANYHNGQVTPCPCFDRFISTIANGDFLLERRIWEMLGYVFVQDQRGKVFFVLQGPSGSGKSVLGNFIRTCFNKEAVSSLELHSFGKNFSKSDLIGRRICLDLDLPDETIDAKAISSLKKLTGSDPVTTDVKYMPLISFMNTAKFLFATNHALYYEHSDDAFKRRIVVIPFTQVIPQPEQNFDLLKDLEQERDAVIVKALSAYCELRERHYIFSGDYTLNATISGGVDLPDLVAQFFNENCMEANIWTPTSEFYEKFCRQFGAVCAKNTFSEMFHLIIKGACPSVEKKRDRIKGQRNPVWGYQGLALKTEDSAMAPMA